MSIKYGFFDSTNHDRVYSSSELGQIFDGIITDGIFQEYKNAFEVTAPGGLMRVNVGTGRAWFKNTWISNDAIYPVVIPDSEVVNNRIDAIVIEINKSKRTNSVKLVKGTGGLTPVKPSMDTGDENIFWYPLAYVRVNALVTEITSENIEDSRGTDNLCPWASGVVQQMSIITILQNWTADFDTFFSDWTVEKRAEFDQFMLTIVNEMSQDEIAALQSQIILKDDAPIKVIKQAYTGDIETTITVQNLDPPFEYPGSTYIVDIYSDPYGLIVESVSYHNNVIEIHHKKLDQNYNIVVLVRKEDVYN